MMLDINDYDLTSDKGRRAIIAATVEKLNQQGGQCATSDGIGCAYSSGRTHCAVGWWLPEDHEAQTFFGGVPELCTGHPDIEELLGCEDEGVCKFWMELQALHDDTGNWDGAILRPDAVSDMIRHLEGLGLLTKPLS